jgi:hypothetical protein
LWIGAVDSIAAELTETLGAGSGNGEHEKPFYATVGSYTNVPWDEALVAYIDFYHNWFRNIPAMKCVELMRAASGHDGFVVFSGADQKQQFIDYMKRRNIVNALMGPALRLCT